MELRLKRYRPAMVPAARAKSDCGTGTGNTSSIMRAKSRSILAMPMSIHGLVLMPPKSEPVSPATKPSDAYASDKPST